MGKLTAADAYDIGFMRKDRALTKTYNIAIWGFCIMLILSIIIIAFSTTDLSDAPENIYESSDGQTLIISHDNSHVTLNLAQDYPNEIIFIQQDNAIKKNDIVSTLGIIFGFVLLLIGLGIAVYYTSYYIPAKRTQAGWDMVKLMEGDEE